MCIRDRYQRRVHGNNEKLRIYFSPKVMEKYFEILTRAGEELKEEIDETQIDCSIDCLNSFIDRVQDHVMQNRLRNQVKLLLQMGKNKAYDRSYAYPYMKRVFESVAETIPEMSEKFCAETGIIEWKFEEPVELSPEEQQKKEDERKAALAEFYKKSKKKPKTEEEEKAALEEVKAHISQDLKQEFFNKFNNIERELEKKDIESKLGNYTRMDYSTFEILNRKKCVADETLDNSVILVRFDLDTELSPTEYEEIEVNVAPSKEAEDLAGKKEEEPPTCLLYTSPSPRDLSTSRMPSSA
eukprot:TRINITY_DN3018_c0_g1_i2.p1 TRINITY_DN3018_c0_g1~~TRINITY_DN3018_c0_g1_i2.p1  ORF type:complete len:298 (+),score=93.05 TRINITY_DN3018_c0_g1_i2:189-1082(+)